MRPLGSPFEDIVAGRPATISQGGQWLLGGRMLTKETAFTDEERARFTALNEAYKARFGFPFIMAVKGRTKAEILAAFERRLGHGQETEIATALMEIERARSSNARGCAGYQNC